MKKRKIRKPRAKPRSYTAQEIHDSNYQVKIFTDGACVPNPGSAGSGIVVYKDNELAEMWYGHNQRGTCNTAELNALRYGIMYAAKEMKEGHSAVIYSDSLYSINSATTSGDNYAAGDWVKPPVNKEIVKDIYYRYQELRKELPILHVRGHAGIEGNELADRMSMLAITARQGKLVRYQGELDVDAILAMRSG